MRPRTQKKKAAERSSAISENLSDTQPSETPQPASAGSNINIQIEISPDDDTDDIEAVVMAARSALEKDIENENE